MKLIFPTIANINVKMIYSKKKLKKSCVIFPTILIKGPILSLYCSMMAILRIRQEIYAEN